MLTLCFSCLFSKMKVNGVLSLQNEKGNITVYQCCPYDNENHLLL